MSQHSEVHPDESISQVITKDHDFMPEHSLEEDMEEDLYHARPLHSLNPISGIFGQSTTSRTSKSLFFVDKDNIAEAENLLSVLTPIYLC
jgi:hypothetical protein